MNPILNEYINSGKPFDEIVNDKIKQNNRNWFLIFSLFATVWTGILIKSHNRVESILATHSQCDSIHSIDQLTIEMQKDKLDSAVYFNEIK